MRNKKNRQATFVCSLSFRGENKRIVSVVGRLNGIISDKILGKKGLDMILFSSQKVRKLHLDKCKNLKKLKLTIDT